MKKFLVSKSDENKVTFVKNAIDKINPDHVYILCEKERAFVYSSIDAVILPLKELNKNSNWITFTNSFTKNSLLVIDNVLKFVFFGDGKKKYLKDVSQSIENIIVIDVVPFYTEPYEIFYPFWFLGKEILGYNSYNTFKANHFEEKEDGSIDTAHSFSILKDKIKDFYVQDYDCFFKKRQIIKWEMDNKEVLDYENEKKLRSENFSNPIKLYNACSVRINLIETKFKLIGEITKELKKACIVINCGGIYPKMFLKYMDNKNVDFLTIHSNPKDFEKYETIIVAEMPIVKTQNWIYIESNFKQNQKIIQLELENNKLEKYFNTKIFNNETRREFDAYFYNANV